MSPHEIHLQYGALELRFQVFRVADAVGLRFPTLWHRRCSRATPVQRIASSISRRRSGLTFSDVSAPLMLSRYACAAKRFQDIIR